MATLITILNTYFFTGIVGSLAYDGLKTSWEAITNRSLEELFLDAFESAMKEQRSHFARYSQDGEIMLDRENIKKLLHQDLAISIDQMGVEEIVGDQFVKDLAKALTQKELIIIGGNHLEQSDYENIVHSLIQLVSAKFKAAITRNEKLFRDAMLKAAQGDRETLKNIQILLMNRFGFIVDFLEILDKKLDDQGNDIRVILHHLKLDRPGAEISTEIKLVLGQHQDLIVEQDDGIWGRIQLKPMPDRYFIAQSFSDNQSDLRRAIEDALGKFSLKSIHANDFFYSTTALNKIRALILSTPFGIYQLNKDQDRNVHLELGMALGMEKPFVLVRDRGTGLSPMLQGLDSFEINSYLETRYKLGDHLESFLAQAIQYKPKKLQPKVTPTRSVVIAHGNLEYIDTGTILAKIVTAFGYTPTILGYDHKLDQYLKREKLSCKFVVAREDIFTAIQEAEFGVYRVDKSATPDTFIALGLAMGFNRLIMPICNSRSKVPSDVEELDVKKFRGYCELEDIFKLHFNSWHQKMHV